MNATFAMNFLFSSGSIFCIGSLCQDVPIGLHDYAGVSPC